MLYATKWSHHNYISPKGPNVHNKATPIARVDKHALHSFARFGCGGYIHKAPLPQSKAHTEGRICIFHTTLSPVAVKMHIHGKWASVLSQVIPSPQASNQITGLLERRGWEEGGATQTRHSALVVVWYGCIHTVSLKCKSKKP